MGLRLVDTGLCLVALVIGLCCTDGVTAMDCTVPTKSGSMKYDNCMTLDGGLKLFYTFSAAQIDVTYSFDAFGWVGFGFAKDRRMVGNAVVIAYGTSNAPNDKFIGDYSLDGKSASMVRLGNRQKLNPSNLDVTIKNGMLYGRFVRPRVIPGEVSVNPGTINVLWAFGSFVPPRPTLISYHADRYALSITLKDSKPPPKPTKTPPKPTKTPPKPTKTPPKPTPPKCDACSYLKDGKCITTCGKKQTCVTRKKGSFCLRCNCFRKLKFGKITSCCTMNAAKTGCTNSSGMKCKEYHKGFVTKKGKRRPTTLIDSKDDSICRYMRNFRKNFCACKVQMGMNGMKTCI